jgi:hypothetical protein
MLLIEPTVEYDRATQAYRQDFLTHGGDMGSAVRSPERERWRITL